MHRFGLALSGVLFLSGCASNRASSVDPTDAGMFGPVSMRIHPTFTQVKDWTGDSKPDGVEAVIELDDQFGEPTRASGTAIFELYAYRAEDPEPRGIRLANWSAPLLTRDQQVAHWNPAVRGYSFQLAFNRIQMDRTYVLSVEFNRKAGGRFFNQVVLEASREGKRSGQPTPHAPLETPARS